MSGKLDQSLDQIMQDSGSAGRAKGGRPRTSRRAAQKAKAAIAAPTGGVQKNTKSANVRGKAPAMAAPPFQAPRRPAALGDSKIIISNLPEDVSETQLKEYFGKAIGATKRVMLTYGPTGRSRGIATVIFANQALGAKAAKTLDGILIDNKAMKVELVLGAKEAPAAALPKSLTDRMSKPKNAAKEAKVAPKGKGAAPTGPANGATAAKGARGKKAGRAGKPTKKTADELDAEMQDYFGGDSGAANGAAAAPAAAATNGAEPVDEVM